MPRGTRFVLAASCSQIATNLAASNHATNDDLKALASFGGRWYAMTARLLLAHGHFEVARQLAVEGRIRYPESPDLFVVLGLLSEWRAGLGLDAGDLRGFIVRGELFDRGLASTSTPVSRQRGAGPRRRRQRSIGGRLRSIPRMRARGFGWRGPTC